MEAPVQAPLDTSVLTFVADPTDTHYLGFGDGSSGSTFGFGCKKVPCVCQTNGLIVKSWQPNLRHRAEGLCDFQALMPPLWDAVSAAIIISGQCGLPPPLARLVTDYSLEYGLTWKEFRELLVKWYTSPLSKEQVYQAGTVGFEIDIPVTLPHLIGTGTSLYGLEVTNDAFWFYSQD